MAVLELGASDCEALSGGWLQQPMNSISSLAYVVAGAYVLRRSGPPEAAVGLVGLGIGSFLYHGPMSPGAELVHDGSLLALPAAIAFACVRRRHLPRPPAVAILAAAVGFTVNLLSRTDAELCRPRSYIQGHAVWHILTAFALAAWLARPPVDRRPTKEPPSESALPATPN